MFLCWYSWSDVECSLHIICNMSHTQPIIIITIIIIIIIIINIL